LGLKKREPMHTTCIITPSYIGDIAQFSLLRKSIEIYARDYPHIVIVHSEDYPAFNSRFGASRNITILKTSDILPSFVENRRKSKIKLVNRFKKDLRESQSKGGISSSLLRFTHYRSANMIQLHLLTLMCSYAPPFAQIIFWKAKK